MARLVIPLTEKKISKTKADSKNIYLRDGNGLLLLITTTGTKIWQFKYDKPTTKKRTAISFGKYPTITLAEARELRNSALKLLAKNIDPQENKKILEMERLSEQQNTFKKIANMWFNEFESKRDITVKTKTRKWNSLQNHVFPAIGQLPINSISALQFIEAVKHLSDKKHLDMLDRVIRVINQIMVYAKTLGLIKENTAKNITKMFNSPKSTHFATITPQELPEFMIELNKAEMTQQTKYLIEFQLLTMTRSNEAARCEWSEIDFENKLWTIPEEKMKNKKMHIIPLSKQAINILKNMERLKRRDDARYVFSSLKSPYLSHMSIESANSGIKHRVKGFKGRLVAHGMRSIASCAMNDCGFDYRAIEIALSHIDSNKIAGAYNHKALLLNQRKKMMQWWANVIDEAKTGSTRRYDKTLLNYNNKTSDLVIVKKAS